MEQKINIEPIKLSDVERMVASVKKNVGDTDVLKRLAHYSNSLGKRQLE